MGGSGWGGAASPNHSLAWRMWDSVDCFERRGADLVLVAVPLSSWGHSPALNPKPQTPNPRTFEALPAPYDCQSGSTKPQTSIPNPNAATLELTSCSSAGTGSDFRGFGGSHALGGRRGLRSLGLFRVLVRVPQPLKRLALQSREHCGRSGLTVPELLRVRREGGRE